MSLRSVRQQPDFRHTTAWIALLAAILICPVAAPPVDIRILSLLAAFLLLCMAAHRLNRIVLVEQLAVAIILAGCTMELCGQFPERRYLLLLMGSLTGWFSLRFFRRAQSAAAWLTVTMGLSTAPFTELFLERNMWILAACLMGSLHTIHSGRLHIQTNRRLQWATGAWILLITLTLLSGFWSVYPHMSLRFTSLLIFNLLVFLQVIATLGQESRRREFVVIILSFAGAYILAAAWSFGARLLSLGWINATGFRIYVFERHPNYTIYYLLMTLPLWLHLMNESKFRIRLTATLGLLTSLCYLVFLSYSRQGYIVITLYLIMLIFLSHTTSSKRFIIRTFVIGFGIFISIFMLSTSLRERLLSIATPNYSLRYNAWKVFIDLIVDKPFLGYGMGVNRYIYPKALGFLSPLQPATRQFLFEAHNAYIDILVSLGIVGLTVFIAFLCICTFTKIRGIGLENRIALVMGIGIGVDLVFNFRLHAQDTSVFLMIFLGYIAVVNSKLDRHTESEKSRANPGLQYLLVTVALMFCALPWLGKTWITKAQNELPGKNWTDIHRLFSYSARLEPLNAHPHYYLAMCYQQMNQPEEATREFRTAVELCPNYPFYRFHLAMNHGEHSLFEDAMQELEIARNLEPYDPDGRVRFNLGILEWKLGYPELARQDFFTALFLNPGLTDDPYWHSNPTLKNRIIDDFINFTGCYTSQTQILSEYFRYLPSTIDVLQHAGHHDLADLRLHTASLNFPQDLQIVLKSVEMLIARDRLSDARNLIYYASNRNPKNSYLLNYLGFIYLKSGDYPMARHCAEHSLQAWREISVDNFVAYQILSEVARITGDRDLYLRVKSAIDYLSDGRYNRQTNDLSIHIGSDSYLVKPIQIQTR